MYIDLDGIIGLFLMVLGTVCMVHCGGSSDRFSTAFREGQVDLDETGSVFRGVEYISAGD